MGDILLVNVYLSTGNQYAVPKSDFTLRLELQKTGLATVPGLLEGFRPFAAPYVVDMSVGTCTCRQFATTNFPCKHIFGVLKYTGKQWSSLPAGILSNPWLNIDFQVIFNPTRGKAILSPINMYNHVLGVVHVTLPSCDNYCVHFHQCAIVCLCLHRL